jgi:integrase
MKRSTQNGSIARHHGWWVVRYREQVGVGGVVKTLCRARRLARLDAHHRTKESVRNLAEALMEPLNRKRMPPLCVTTLGDFVDRVYLPFVKQQKRPSTYRGYVQIWNAYLKGRCGSEWMRDIRTFHLQAWLEEIAREPRKPPRLESTLSKTTLAHIKNFLSGVFRHAAQQGYFDEANPAKLAEIPAFAPRAKEGRAYSLEDVGQMLRILPEPAATIVAMAAYTGLRLGELQGLNWEDYAPPDDNDKLGLVEVRRSVWRGTAGEPKTERSKSPVPVMPQLVERLAHFRQLVNNPDRGPVFANAVGNPMDLNAHYYRQMRKALATAGVEWLGWHGFRRGLASNLNRLGVDDSVIQAILRHSDIAVTQRCYIKTARPDTLVAMRQLSKRLSEMERKAQRSFVSSLDHQNSLESESVCSSAERLMGD